MPTIIPHILKLDPSGGLEVFATESFGGPSEGERRETAKGRHQGVVGVILVWRRARVIGERSTSMTHGDDPNRAAAARRERGEDVARIFLRPIASPLALGFLALGGATLVLSGTQLGWIPLPETK